MDRKGQIGMLIIVATAIIIGAVLLTTVANQASVATTTATITNASYTSNAIVNSTITLAGQGFQGTPVVKNNTKDVSSEFTISTTSGVIYMKTLDTAAIANNNGTKLNVSYTQEPTGYADSATRSIIPVIIIFFALAIAVIALWPVIKDISGLGA